MTFIDHQAAIIVYFADVDAVLFQNFVHQLTPHGTKISSQYQIVVRGRGAGVGQIVVQSLCSSGGHCSPHVVGILNAQISDAPKGHRVNLDFSTAVGPHYNGTRRRSGPLGGRGALAAVF